MSSSSDRAPRALQRWSARFVAVGLLLALSESVFAQVPIIAERQILRPVAADNNPQLFGTTFAVEGDTALVGMRGSDNIGRVAVYTRNAAGTWQRTDTLINPDPMPPGGDQFGVRVALDGNVAVIQSGAGLHILRRSDTVWRHTQILADASPFGFVFENGVIVLHTNGEVVLTYKDNGSGRFQRTTFFRPLVNADDRLSVALDATAHWLVVGDPQDRQGIGAAYVYRQWQSQWIAHQTLIAIDGQPGDQFGWTVAIDDRAIVVGAPRGPRPNDAAYVFRRAGRFWYERATLEPGTLRNRGFGPEVALNGRYIMMSTPQDPGEVFLYNRCNGFVEPDFRLVGEPINVLFGEVLDVSGSTVFVGGRDDRTSDTRIDGFVYAYKITR
jgi:hypothetical protein